MAETESETTSGESSGRLEKLLPPPMRRPARPGRDVGNGDGAGTRVGDGAKEANQYVTRDYRKPFVVPEQV